MKKQLKTYKKPLFVGLFLILLLSAYFYRHRWMGWLDKRSITPGVKIGGPSNINGVLGKGSRGEQVRQLQQLLNAHHKKNLPQYLSYLEEDGIFGDKTEFMLKKWTGKTRISIRELKEALQ